MNINISRKVFNAVYQKYINDQTRKQIFFGGSSSGKSVFLAQRCICDLLKSERNYLIARNVGNTLRVSVFNELKKVISEWGIDGLFTISKTDLTITCKNGYQAVLKGLDDAEKIKSITPEKGIFTDIWVEEATECFEDDLTQLEKRLRGKSNVPKRITLSFNPIMKTHWIYEKYFKEWDEDKKVLKLPGLLIVKTTYKDNKFLEKEDHIALEDETNDYFYQVYTLGNWGVLGDVIFTNWKVKDIRNSAIYRTFDQFKNGLDFGYTNDPTAFNRTFYHKARKTIYIVDEFHEFGMSNEAIARRLEPIINKEYIICDSAEPKSIEELCNLGISALGARKGKDSILHGIQWLQQQKIIIDRTCQHTKNEFEQYQWKKNKDGQVMNIPVDRNNHHIDDIRYQYEDEMLPPKRLIPRVRVI